MSLTGVTSARWQHRKPQAFHPPIETPWVSTKPAASKWVGKFITPFHHDPS